MPGSDGLLEDIMRSLLRAYVKASVDTNVAPVSEAQLRADAVEYASTRSAKLLSQMDSDRGKLMAEMYEKKQLEGWSENKYIYALMDKGYSATAARRYARTESAIVYNVSEADAWQQQGVELVRITDGVDDEFCKFANGSVWTVADYNLHPIAHPNCVRTASPIPDSDTAKMRRYVKQPHPEEPSVNDY